MPEIQTPLARLVLFMVCLAFAGSILAGTHYYAIDLPQQQKVTVPENNVPLKSGCKICQSNCAGVLDYYNCITECDLIC
jgi:hypothetical protein